MILSTNNVAQHENFIELLERVVQEFRQRAKSDPKYYLSRNGIKLEDDVVATMQKLSKGTEFEGSIKKISGFKFPDIIAKGYYGVEVKTTIKDSWECIGNSVLEGTRIDGVERIYLFFAKLFQGAIDFRCKPYQDCLCDVAVTHSPRYRINMDMSLEETIFEKMGVSYDDLRNKDRPIESIVDYYRNQLKSGDELWWMGKDSDEYTANAIVRQWGNLSSDDKEHYKLMMVVLFPEVLGPISNHKYTRATTWLFMRKGVVYHAVRDIFSAGGQEDFLTSAGKSVKISRTFKIILENKDKIFDLIKGADAEDLESYWGCCFGSEQERIEKWLSLLRAMMVPNMLTENVFEEIFK